MSALLTLARDYIERMANPVFGITMNEDYAIKFGTLLGAEGFESQLQREIRALKDPDVLSSHGWLWLFEWAKSTHTDLNQELLLRLFHRWTNPIVMAEIILLATRDFHEESRVRRNVYDFPNPFLARILKEVTSSGEVDRPDLQPLRGIPAQRVLVALLQAGSPIALDAASALLWHPWEGQHDLLEFFRMLFESLDTETRDIWLHRLDPPR